MKNRKCVHSIFFDIRGYIEISVFEITELVISIMDQVFRFIIYLKRSPFTLHWSNNAIFFAYCTESSAYSTELRSHVH